VRVARADDRPGRNGRQDLEMPTDLNAELILDWFRRTIACSEVLFTLLNRGANIELQAEEQAAHALCGGVLSQGHACGQLWGAALATAVRAQKSFLAPATSGAATLYVTCRLADEFQPVAGSLDCREIIERSLTTRWAKIKYVFSGKPQVCRAIAVKWAPSADELIDKFLGEFDSRTLATAPANCAMRTMCALGFEKDAVLAAGFAGGVGLKGNVCGALAAGCLALGLRFYRRRHGPRDSALKAILQEAGIGETSTKAATRLFDAFIGRYGTLLCSKLTRRKFNSVDDHSKFVAEGGCCDLITSISECAKAIR
jgi:hypothetical protein